MSIQEYLAARVKTIEASIAAEVLSGNKVKEQCERFALTEITAIGIEIARQGKWSAEQRQSTSKATPFIKQCSCGKSAATVHLCDQCFEDAVS